MGAFAEPTGLREARTSFLEMLFLPVSGPPVELCLLFFFFNKVDGMYFNENVYDLQNQMETIFSSSQVREQVNNYGHQYRVAPSLWL